MINIEQHEDLLKVSYINSDGNVELMGIQVPEKEKFKWEYANVKKSKNYISWDGKPVKKTRARFLNKFRMTEFLWNQPKEVQDVIFGYNKPNMYFVDIETEILDEFPSPKNPKAKITCITFADENSNVLTLALKELSPKRVDQIEKKLNAYFKDFGYDINYEYISYKTEFDMLYTFLKKFAKKMPLITGWNFTSFDWSYIMARSKKLGIDTGICSITGTLYDMAQSPLDPKAPREIIKLPMHKIIVDYLQVYKRWDYVVSPKESDTLDWVSQKVLGVKKLHYNGTLTDLERDYYDDYILYNSIDAYLVKLLHEKLNSVAPYLALGSLTRVEHHKVYASSAMISNILCMELLKLNKILIPKDYSSDGKGYKGAFVFPVEPGFHKWLLTFDFASLYPTTIRQHNISPELYLGKIDKIPKKLDPNIIYCASGATFRNDIEGALPILSTKIYSDRKNAKTNYGELEAEIKELKMILKNKN